MLQFLEDVDWISRFFSSARHHFDTMILECGVGPRPILSHLPGLRRETLDAGPLSERALLMHRLGFTLQDTKSLVVSANLSAMKTGLLLVYL